MGFSVADNGLLWSLNRICTEIQYGFLKLLVRGVSLGMTHLQFFSDRTKKIVEF